MHELDPPLDLPEHPTLSYKGPKSLATLPPPGDGPETIPPVASEDATFAPAAQTGFSILPVDSQPAYRLLRKVAVGGMGEVWEAVQTSLGRVVAIKVIRPDRLRRDPREAVQLIQESRREAVFAARLEHPNILPVHDLATDESGAPMLAMKFVQGTPWDKELAKDFHTLSPPQLLGKHLPTLIAVAQAVAFAHSRGVVHRDLKPAQVMLGGFGEVLLIDWGLAVFTGDETLLNETRRLGLPELESHLTASSPSGTPALMAPEQTMRTAEGIGTWTDIYLLGGTLYYLLTGSYPHEDANVHRSFMRARAGEVDPPSRRAPNREVPADLERLCLLALHPEARDRCASAQDFIAALQDHISGETRRRESRDLVARARAELASGSRDYSRLAGCASLLEQAQALWQANPDLPSLREEVFATHAGLALGNSDLVLARVQAERIDRGPTRERLLADVAAGERAARSRQRTRRLAIGSALSLLTLTVVGGAFFTHQLSRSRDAESAQRAVAEAQRDLARDARGKSDSFARFVLEDMTNRLAALNRLDLLDPAVERALAYYSSVPFSRLSVEEWGAPAEGLVGVMSASRRRGNPQTQEAALQALTRLFDGLPPEQAAQPEWQKRLGDFLIQKSQFQSGRGDLTAALETIRQCGAVFESLATAEPEVSQHLDNLTEAFGEEERLLNLMGRHPESVTVSQKAVDSAERAIAIGGESRIRLLHRLTQLHRLLLYKARVPPDAEGDALAVRVRELANAAYEEVDPDGQSSSTAAAAFIAAAEWERTQGKTSRGIEDARRAVELYRRVQQIQPGVMAVQRSLADSYSILASMQSQAGDPAGAADSYAEGLAVIEALLARDPGNTDTLSILCVLLNNNINAALALRRIDEARALSDRQRVAAAELLELSPDRGNAGRAVALAAVRRIAVHRAAGEVEKGLEAGREAVRIADEMALRFPQEPELRQNRIVARSWYAGLLGEANRREESLEVSREICLAADEAAAADPRLHVSWETVGGTYSNYSEALRNAGRMREAQDASARSVAAFRTLLELDPMRVVSMASLANALLGQGSVLEVGGDIEAAAAAHTEAVKIGLSLEELDPNNNNARDTVVRASATMARLLADHGREAEAADFIDTALAAHRRQLERVPDPKEAERFARDNSLYRVVMAANALNNLDLMVELLEQIRASRAMDKTPTINDRVLASQLEGSTGRALAQAGRIREALEATTSSTLILQQLTTENPANAFLLAEHAIALQVDASYAHHLGDFQRVLVSSGKAIESLNAMQPAVASSAQNSITWANILRTRAAALTELGRTDEALADLDESLSRLAPSVEAGVAGAIRGRVDGLVAKAQALARSGRLAEARTALDEAAAIRPWRNESEDRRRLLDRTLLAGELELADASGDAARIRECLENLLAAFQPRPGRGENMNAKATRAVVLLRLGRAQEAAPLVAEVRASDFRGGRFFEPLTATTP